MLTEECHHRLLNNLQMIVALLTMQSRKEANAEAAARLTVAADRVRAIAGLHHHLHSMDSTPTVEFKPFLDALCRDHSTMSMSEERPDQLIVVEAIELNLPTTVGIPLSLIVNELVTNAIKHGRGRITVTLAPSAKGHALSVCNDGVELPEGFDPSRQHDLGMPCVCPPLSRRSAARCGSIAATPTTARDSPCCSPDFPRRSGRTLLRSLPSGPPRTISPAGGPGGEHSGHGYQGARQRGCHGQDGLCRPALNTCVG